MRHEFLCLSVSGLCWVVRLEGCGRGTDEGDVEEREISGLGCDEMETEMH